MFFCVSKLDFDSAVEDSSFRVRVDFAEGRVLVRRKYHWSETALASICNILGVDEKTCLTERLFAKDSEYRKRFCLEPVAQELTARVIGLDTSFEVFLSFKQQSRVYSASRNQGQGLIAS